MVLKTPKNIVVCCVSFETTKVTKPIEYILDQCKIHRVHILHSVLASSPGKNKVYQAFYDEVEKNLLEMGIRDIVPHNIPVYEFNEVLKEMHNILREEKQQESNIYVNITAGTPEYASAATIACMLEMEDQNDSRIIPLSVHVKPGCFTVDAKHYFEDQDINKKPIGLAKDVYPPEQLHLFPITPPPEDLVRGLRTLADMQQNNRVTTYAKTIEELKRHNIWDYTPEDTAKDPVQSEKMYYRRHYLDKWEECGWITQKGKTVTITDAGQMVIDVFYT